MSNCCLFLSNYKCKVTTDIKSDLMEPRIEVEFSRFLCTVAWVLNWIEFCVLFASRWHTRHLQHQEPDNTRHCQTFCQTIRYESAQRKSCPKLLESLLTCCLLTSCCFFLCLAKIKFVSKKIFFHLDPSWLDMSQIYYVEWKVKF